MDIPPVGLTALTWGLFMGASSNVRYQIVFGLERLVDATVAKCAHSQTICVDLSSDPHPPPFPLAVAATQAQQLAS